jgi:hypothetical protein
MGVDLIEFKTGAWQSRGGCGVATKPTKTREELSSVIFARLNEHPDSSKVTGVVIAPVLRRRANYPNWHAAFTTKGRNPVPHIAWQIGSEVAAQIDLA